MKNVPPISTRESRAVFGTGSLGSSSPEKVMFLYNSFRGCSLKICNGKQIGLKAEQAGKWTFLTVRLSSMDSTDYCFMWQRSS